MYNFPSVAKGYGRREVVGAPLTGSRLSGRSPRPGPRVLPLTNVQPLVFRPRTVEMAPRISKFSFANGTLVSAVASKTFQECDFDKSGDIDLNELYIAVLLTYDKLNKVCPVHVKPPKKRAVQELFEEYDADKSGRLDREEFGRVIKTLVAGDTNNWRTSIWWRVTYLWGLKALLCPLAAYLIITVMSKFIEAAANWPQGPLAFVVELLFKLTAGRLLL